ncbi:putative PCTP-like protein [Sesbania bispinosa]|nr:putative PCTP-like protein [Sesbania bispinosa]
MGHAWDVVGHANWDCVLGHAIAFCALGHANWICVLRQQYAQTCSTRQISHEGIWDAQTGFACCIDETHHSPWDAQTGFDCPLFPSCRMGRNIHGVVCRYGEPKKLSSNLSATVPS